MIYRLVLLSFSFLLMPLLLPASAELSGDGHLLAEADGVAITVEEVEKALAGTLAKLEEQIYALKRQKVEALLGERLLANEAAKRGMSVAALLDAEVTEKVTLVTEQELEPYYQKSKGQLQGEESAVRAQIRAQVQNQKLAAQRESFMKSLREKAKAVVYLKHLKAPAVFRAEVTVDGAPSKGPGSAPVTIVKFEDFHCPFCKKIQPTFTELLSRYPETVKLVHRDFPIDQLHPGARKAHEAARCANEQGKFWTFHDLVYANAPKTSPEQLKGYAEDAGLDLVAFEQCLSSGKYQAEVQKDVEEGTRAGVTGTPSFFINGRMLAGAQPLESFTRIIEEELNRTQ